MVILCWRFDDLNFAEEMDGSRNPLPIQEKIASILDKRRCKATFGLITNYNNKDYTTNRPYFRFIKNLQKKGHEIAAHGVHHNSWIHYSTKELGGIINKMREDFDAMDIPVFTFIFPGLQTNWRALPLLKKNGFEIIIKGERYNPLKRMYIKAMNSYYAKKYGLNFFVPHSFSTERSYSPPILQLPQKIGPQKEMVHVMDHIWLYKQEDLKKFSMLVSSSCKAFEWRTISEAAAEQIKNNKFF